MKLSGLRTFKFNKTWIVLGVALAAGLAAALGAKHYLANQMAAIEARAKGKTVAIVVAKRDLAKGTRLSAESLAVRPVPQDFAHSAAVVPEQFDGIDGQVLAYPVKSGEMIFWGLLESRKSAGFSSRVESGRRAMTVQVDEINSISGLLEPGDAIDLMVTIDQRGRKITFPLVQNVKVMATGQRSVDDKKSGERRQYSSVTLDTTPEQAQIVIVAREAGRITALLRNPQDRKAMSNVRRDLAALLGIRNGKDEVFDNDERQVPVLYGGRAGKLPPEGLQLGQYASASDSAFPTGSGSQVPGLPAAPRHVPAPGRP